MKKIFTLLCTFCMMCCLVACGGNSQNTSSEPKENNFTTMGEAYQDSLDDRISGYEMSESYIKILSDDYVYEGTMTPELYAKINAIDFMADDKDEQYVEILKEVPIEKKTLRSESKLTDEQISSLIGKKGQELIDMGFTNFGYNTGEANTVFFMDKNGYSYHVKVEEKYSDDDLMDSMTVFAESTIKEITEEE